MKLVSTNPSRGYEVVGEVEAFSSQEVARAVATARAAQPAWAALSQEERNLAVESFVVVCEQYAEELALTVSREMGKPIVQARTQVDDGFRYFRAFMSMAGVALAPEVVFEDETQAHYLTREPLGVVVCIAPWNFPFLNLPWQTGQALLAGNAVLFKPSEEIVVFASLIKKLVGLSDLPEGVFTVVIGDGEIGERLAQEPVDAIIFTGSSRTGQVVAELAAKRSTRLLTEMGGSSPGIVFEDAEVARVIETIYGMRFGNTGQYCDGLKRLLVHETRLTDVLDALRRVNATKKVGDAMDEGVDFGPLVAKRQLDLLKTQVGDALSKGAKVFFGGKEPDGLEGAYYQPTVLTGVSRDMRVWQEEVFGPVLSIVTFSDEREAVALANDTQYGLSAHVFTADSERYRRVAGKLQVGMVGHNNALFYSPNSPFGGYKKSGNSRTCGKEGFYEVTQTKLVSEEKTQPESD